MKLSAQELDTLIDVLQRDWDFGYEMARQVPKGEMMDALHARIRGMYEMLPIDEVSKSIVSVPTDEQFDKDLKELI